MSYLKLAIVAVAGMAYAFSLPVSAADAKSGSVMMVSPDGKMSKMPMPDKAHMDMIMQHAVPLSDDMAVIVWGAKTYMVKNEKMPDGRMTFDVWGIRFER